MGADEYEYEDALSSSSISPSPPCGLPTCRGVLDCEYGGVRDEEPGLYDDDPPGLYSAAEADASSPSYS